MTVSSIPWKTPFGQIGVSVLAFANGEPIDRGVVKADAAFRRAIDAIAALDSDNTHQGMVLVAPRGNYVFDNRLSINRQIILQGEGGWGTNGWEAQTQFTFATNRNGIVFEYYNTSTDGGSGEWSVVRDIGIKSAGSNTKTVCGVRYHARGLVERCAISGFTHALAPIADSNADSNFVTSAFPIEAFAGDTTYLEGDSVRADSNKWYICKRGGVSSSAPSGTALSIEDANPSSTLIWGYVAGTNCNGWQAQNCRISATSHAFFSTGRDANAGLAIAVDVGGCGGWCFREDSFLGNTFLACQAADGVLGAYSVPFSSGTSVFLGCYSEGGQPPSDINPVSVVIGGLHGAGFVDGIRPSGIIGQRMGPTTFQVLGADDVVTVGGNYMVGFSRSGVNSFNKSAAYNGTPTGVQNTAYWNWAGLSGMTGWGQALDGNSIWQTGAERARYMQPPQLWTALGYGILVEGKRVSFCDSTTRPSLGFGGPVTDFEGDLIFKRTPVAGESPGWVCTVGGTSSAYSEGRTATSAGGTSLTLSGVTHNTHGIQIGDRVQINGVTTYVANRGTHDTTSITVADAIPAGSALAITYVPGTWVPMPALPGGGADSTGTPGNATQNTRKGRVAVAIGAAAVTITNSLVTATSIIGVALQSNDATLTQVLRVVPGSGSFTITGNANATAATNVAWWLIE